MLRNGTYWVALIAIFGALVGCPESNPPATEDAGTQRDAASGAEDAAVLEDAASEGDAAVAVDAAPDTDAGPAPDCSAQDARGEGACDAFFGYAWDGSGCAGLSGCSCVGADCGATFESVEACQEAHASCERSCGGFLGLTCADTEYCDYPDGSMCGAADQLGVCRARPDDCLLPGGVPVCGCDGEEYLGECSAYLAGTDVAYIGECRAPGDFVIATARPGCGPTDGPAWFFSLTHGAYGCEDELSGVERLEFAIWSQLDGAAPRTYELRGDGPSVGYASLCDAAGDCQSASGTIEVISFSSSGTALLAFDLQVDGGARLVQTNVSIAAPHWCASLSPFCG